MTRREEEQAELKAMYYQRMVKAESALDSFVNGRLTIQRARGILQEAKDAVARHIRMFPD